MGFELRRSIGGIRFPCALGSIWTTLWNPTAFVEVLTVNLFLDKKMRILRPALLV